MSNESLTNNQRKAIAVLKAISPTRYVRRRPLIRDGASVILHKTPSYGGGQIVRSGTGEAEMTIVVQFKEDMLVFQWHFYHDIKGDPIVDSGDDMCERFVEHMKNFHG